jgi:putative N6-adenine-specific DNA methylase
MEAAMLAMKIPAGYYRKTYAFLNWSDFDSELWEKVKSEGNDMIEETECSIIASDRSETAVAITKRNLKHAGLHKDVIVEHKYFDDLKPELENGILVFNPPYGKRLEERGELRDLYKKIGDVLKQDYSGFEAWIITPNTEAAKFVGLRPSRKITLFNGPIETRYLKFEMYEGTKKGKGNFSSDDYKRKRQSNFGNRFKRGEGDFKKKSFSRSDKPRFGSKPDFGNKKSAEKKTDNKAPERKPRRPRISKD